ncbi:MAG: hypothetical protein FGM32_06370 [Candidatus Kapabacteria bacterium]|nr:hypothetical protein [Candidatus Kapabacteria bacterium]
MALSRSINAIVCRAALLCAFAGAAHLHAQDSALPKAPWPHSSCNSPADEYAPAVDLRGSGMLFTSERSGVSQVYHCSASGKVLLVGGTFNEKGRAAGYVSITSGGDGLGARYLLAERQTFSSIVRVTRTADAIELGQPLENVNGQFYASQPTISPDDTRMMLVSDREGGFGGLDIWMLERRVDGTWSAMQHAGEALNSPGDEISPVLVSSDTLLFASNGMGGLGGFDLYMSVYRNGRWSDPVPLDEINTGSDESDACILPDGTICFASNRAGGQGGFDLWLWKP